MRKVLVIGAGIGGLSAAIRLQHAGYEVHIYEKEGMPGGKMHRIEMEGHSFDVGPTLVMMPSIYREIFELADRNPDDYISMKKLNPMYNVYFNASPMRFYSLSNDLQELHQIFEGKGSNNASGFYDYLTSIYKRYQIALEHFITKPFRYKRDFYNPKTLWQALKLKTFDSADHMMAQFIPDKDLQQMLSFQTLYIGVSPKKGPSLYNIIPMIELMYGVWFLKGGMHTMAKQMARLFEELGGKIHYHSKVEEILTEHQQVKGILVNGETVFTDSIVCNADFPYAMKYLLKEPIIQGKYTSKNIDNMDYSCSCLVFYWGVKGVYPDLAVHTFVIADDLETNLNSIFDGRLIQDPSIYLHIPSNADSSMAPEGKSSFYVLMPISDVVVSKYSWNQETINHYRSHVLATLKKLPVLQELDKNITCEQVYTPEDFMNRFHAYRGATFGLQPTLLQSNHLRPQAKCLTCKGLYFVGSSTHPGAGVPIVMQSGKICAQEFLKDEKGV